MRAAGRVSGLRVKRHFYYVVKSNHMRSQPNTRLVAQDPIGTYLKDDSGLGLPGRLRVPVRRAVRKGNFFGLGPAGESLITLEFETGEPPVLILTPAFAVTGTTRPTMVRTYSEPSSSSLGLL